MKFKLKFCVRLLVSLRDVYFLRYNIVVCSCAYVYINLHQTLHTIRVFKVGAFLGYFLKNCGQCAALSLRGDHAPETDTACVTSVKSANRKTTYDPILTYLGLFSVYFVKQRQQPKCHRLLQQSRQRQQVCIIWLGYVFLYLSAVGRIAHTLWLLQLTTCYKTRFNKSTTLMLTLLLMLPSFLLFSQRTNWIFSSHHSSTCLSLWANLYSASWSRIAHSKNEYCIVL